VSVQQYNGEKHVQQKLTVSQMEGETKVQLLHIQLDCLSKPELALQ